MSDEHCDQIDKVHAYAFESLPVADAAAIEAHVASCARCRAELDAFAWWPKDLLQPARSLQARLASRIAAETGSAPVLPQERTWSEPPWKQVAPGIECKLLSRDLARQLVSMLVRLAPGAEYPPHVHADFEELHLLHGELWIDERKLYPGDYNRAESGTGDKRVWSETGCTCVLITSTQDRLG